MWCPVKPKGTVWRKNREKIIRVKPVRVYLLVHKPFPPSSSENDGPSPPIRQYIRYGTSLFLISFFPFVYILPFQINAIIFSLIISHFSFSPPSSHMVPLRRPLMDVGEFARWQFTIHICSCEEVFYFTVDGVLLARAQRRGYLHLRGALSTLNISRICACCD